MFKGLDHPDYQTKSHLPLAVSCCADSFGFICPPFETSVSETSAAATKFFYVNGLNALSVLSPGGTVNLHKYFALGLS